MATTYDDEEVYEQSVVHSNALVCRTCHALVEKWNGHAPAHVQYHAALGEHVITKTEAEK